MNIYSIDFLLTHRLIVDPANCRLVQAIVPLSSRHGGDQQSHHFSHHKGQTPPCFIFVDFRARLGGLCKSALRVVSCCLQCWHWCLCSFTHSSTVWPSSSCSCQPSTAGSQFFSKPRPAQQDALFFQLLLQGYEDVMNLSMVPPKMSHSVEHHLQIRGLPIASYKHAIKLKYIDFICPMSDSSLLTSIGGLKKNLGATRLSGEGVRAHKGCPHGLCGP